MIGLVARRLLALIPMLFLVSLGVFSMTQLIPGDPAVELAGGLNATPERIKEVRTELGFDKPFFTQYFDWAKDAVRLDFGKSLLDKRSVTETLRNRLPVTASIVFWAIVFGLVIGLPAGLIAGMRPGGARDRAVIFTTNLGIAIPSFVFSMLLITLFAVKNKWFPAIGFKRLTDQGVWPWFKSCVLPSLSLSLLVAATMARQLRSALSDVMLSSYVRTAWAKGAPLSRVVGKHALKNAAIPPVTILGFIIAGLLGGGVIIESLFSIPGIGSYILNAARSKDLPVIQGAVIFFVLIYVLISLLIDITYGFLNPKIRVS